MQYVPYAGGKNYIMLSVVNIKLIQKFCDCAKNGNKTGTEVQLGVKETQLISMIKQGKIHSYFNHLTDFLIRLIVCDNFAESY